MNLNESVMQSVKLDERLSEFLLPADFPGTERLRCAAILCAVVFEHASGVKMLLVNRHFTSAIGLMRLQYEALVRAMWIRYAASENVVTKLMSDLTLDTARVANKLPMLKEMLSALEGKPPKEATAGLLEFKEYSWRPLSSFVHGGIHAIDRNRRGYPEALILQALKASNGISVMTGMLLIILAGNPAHKGKNPDIQIEFATVLPEPRPRTSTGSGTSTEHKHGVDP